MFLPIGDEPNLRGTPYVTYGILGINVAIFVFISLPLMSQAANPADPELPAFLQLLWQQMGNPGSPSGYDMAALMQRITAYDLFTFKYGFKPADPSLFNLFVSMFLHGSFLHVAGNMLFLWIYGDNVELQVGRVPYMMIYLGTGVAASVFHMIFRLESMTPMVGASGAISGILGCYFMWFPHNRIKIVIFFFFIQMVKVPARWVLGFYLVVENLLPFLIAPATGGGVAYGAHIGGFLGGLLIARLVQSYGHTAFGKAVRERTGRFEDKVRYRFDSQDDMVAPRFEFEQALQREHFERALKAYGLMSIAERNLLEARHVFMLADWLADRHRFDVALGLLQRLIASRPPHADLARAHLRAGLVLLYGLQRPAAAREHFYTVLDLNPAADTQQAAKDALAQMGQT